MAAKRANPKYGVYDGGSKLITRTKSKKVAQFMARAIGGHVGARGTIVYSARGTGKRKSNPACQGSGWKMNPNQALAFPTKAAAKKYARENGLTGFRIRRNPAAGSGRGGKATGAGAGGAGGGAGAGSQGGTSRTEVRSPTRTATSTKAKTWGNITVTGGAGRGATTTVKVEARGKKNPLPVGRAVTVKAIRRGNGRIDLFRAR